MLISISLITNKIDQIFLFTGHTNNFFCKVKIHILILPDLSLLSLIYS